MRPEVRADHVRRGHMTRRPTTQGANFLQPRTQAFEPVREEPTDRSRDQRIHAELGVGRGTTQERYGCTEDGAAERLEERLDRWTHWTLH